MNPDLLDRLLGLLTPEQSTLALPPVAIIAAMRERQRGQITRANIAAVLGLSAEEDTALNTIYQNCVALILPPYNFDTVLDLLNLGATRNRIDPNGAPYYTKAQIKTRLGI